MFLSDFDMTKELQHEAAAALYVQEIEIMACQKGDPMHSEEASYFAEQVDAVWVRTGVTAHLGSETFATARHPDSQMHLRVELHRVLSHFGRIPLFTHCRLLLFGPAFMRSSLEAVMQSCQERSQAQIHMDKSSAFHRQLNLHYHAKTTGIQ